MHTKSESFFQLTSHVCLFFITLLLLFSFSFHSASGKEATPTPETAAFEMFIVPLPAETQTQFLLRTETETITLPYSIEYRNTDELEIGEEAVSETGQNGSITNTYEVEYYQGEESNRTILTSERVEPKPEVILKGTKIIWRTTDTPEGALTYWKKLNVYAVAYTAQSAGKPKDAPGYGITATGTRAHFGTVAVDPRVIPLGTRMYIPGYGYGTAEDTGGSIKGNIIDLFYEGDHGWWNARYTDIYLLD